MKKYNIKYQKQYNNFILEIDRISIEIDFLEFRILKQKLKLLNPISSAMDTISLKIDNIIIKLDREEFTHFSFCYYKYYSYLINELYYVINSEKLYVKLYRENVIP